MLWVNRILLFYLIRYSRELIINLRCKKFLKCHFKLWFCALRKIVVQNCSDRKYLKNSVKNCPKNVQEIFPKILTKTVQKRFETSFSKNVQKMFKKNSKTNCSECLRKIVQKILEKIIQNVQKGCWRKNVGTYIKKYSNNLSYKDLSLTTLKGIEEQRSSCSFLFPVGKRDRLYVRNVQWYD